MSWAPVGASFPARSRARCAIATAVSALQACSGSKPRNAASARASYGTSASSRSRDPPGTRSSSAIAPLPPPVIASTAWRPDACISAIVCRHDDTSSWLRVLSALTAATLHRMVEEILDGVNGVVCSDNERLGWRPRSRNVRSRPSRYLPVSLATTGARISM